MDDVLSALPSVPCSTSSSAKPERPLASLSADLDPSAHQCGRDCSSIGGATTATAALETRTLRALESAFNLSCLEGKASAPSRLWDEAPLSPEEVRSIPPETLRKALDAIILQRRADLGLNVLRESGLLAVIFPEVTALVGFGEGEAYHKDVWRHTERVVIQSVPRLGVRWAALFHDIGKPATRSMDPKGIVHFLHHAEVGARMFDRLARRERLFPEPELRDLIRFLVYHHQRAHQYEASWTDSATRRFAREIGPHLADLLALSRADMTTRRKDKRRRFMFQIKTLNDRIEKLLEEDSRPKALPKGLGEALIAEFSLPPSKLVGDIRRALETAVESGELPGLAEFSVYLDYVRAHRSRFNLPAASGPQLA
jgi:poly(A) polymerase